MRLINSSSLRLQRFDDDHKIPPYAILSHTWGSEELSLQDFTDALVGHEFPSAQITGMSGFEKICLACAQAVEDGLKWVWVDTCCIDKTSSAELSEAINSMYRWYRKAQVCYAYLEDISPDHESYPPAEYRRLASRKAMISPDILGKARWLTRGWTLQEMIAPSHIKFFGSGWDLFGNKGSLATVLEKVTGIDEYILRSTVPKLERVSVARRMSWAAKRTTTRTEDIAYSLMGIFGVNMPLLYGEGEKAFVRLQEEILKENEDQTLFAWIPSPNRQTLFEYHGQHVVMGVSIFAEHPREFARSADFYPLVPQGDPPAVTNKGIKIELPIVKLRETPESIVDDNGSTPLFLVVLYCREGSTQRFAAIVVRRLHSDGQSHTYVRHETAELLSVRLEDVFMSDTRQMYLRRRPQELSQREQWSLGRAGRPSFVEARMAD